MDLPKTTSDKSDPLPEAREAAELQRYEISDGEVYRKTDGRFVLQVEHTRALDAQTKELARLREGKRISDALHSQGADKIDDLRARIATLEQQVEEMGKDKARLTALEENWQMFLRFCESDVVMEDLREAVDKFTAAGGEHHD